GRWRAGTPVKIDRRVLAHQHRGAVEVTVVKIVTTPHVGRGSWRVAAGPTQPRYGPADKIKILQADGEIAAGQIDITRIGCRPWFAPLVDDQGVVDPEPGAIIDRDSKAIIAGWEVERARPAHRKIVIAHNTGRR